MVRQIFQLLVWFLFVSPKGVLGLKLDVSGKPLKEAVQESEPPMKETNFSHLCSQSNFFWRSLKLETVVKGWNADPALLPRRHSDTAQRPHYCWHRISRPVHLTVELNLSLERDPETLKLLSNASLVVTARSCSRKWETELVTRVQCCLSPAPSEKMQMHISFCNAKKINTHLYVHLYRHTGTTRSTW